MINFEHVIFKANSNLVVKATKLCKADLCCEVVYEMPELQGKIGSIYAKIQKMPSEVVLSIKEHYSPLGPSDSCPTSPESSLLSLSDKLDSLIGFIAIDMKATGSKDPFDRPCWLRKHTRPCLLYTSPSPRDLSTSRMPSSA